MLEPHRLGLEQRESSREKIGASKATRNKQKYCAAKWRPLSCQTATCCHLLCIDAATLPSLCTSDSFITKSHSDFSSSLCCAFLLFYFVSCAFLSHRNFAIFFFFFFMLWCHLMLSFSLSLSLPPIASRCCVATATAFAAAPSPTYKYTRNTHRSKRRNKREKITTRRKLLKLLLSLYLVVLWKNTKQHQHLVAKASDLCELKISVWIKRAQERF